MSAMKPIWHAHLPRYSRGFSLIELMISLTIGLVIIVAALSAYMGASNAGKMAEVQSRMNEDAQAALSILAQQLRMAGSNPGQPGRPDPYRKNPIYAPYATTTFTTTAANLLTSYSIRGCDGRFSNIVTPGITIDTLDACAASDLPDSIAISYEADKYNTVPTSSGPSDCNGSTLSTVNATFTGGTAVTTATFSVAENRYYVTSTTSIPTSLYCKGNGGTAQPMVENIEDMQFQYGVVAGTASTVMPTATQVIAPIAGYLRADQIEGTSITSLQALSVADRWAKVSAVRICVVVRSEGPVVSDTNSGQYYKCDGTLDTTQTDLRLRRAYSTTVALRNRQLWLP